MSGLWRRAALRRQKFGGGRELVVCGEAAEAMGTMVAEALELCREFATLEEHAERAWRRFSGRSRWLAVEAADVVERRGGRAAEGREVVVQALESLARGGFLVSRDGLLGRPAAPKPVAVALAAVMGAGPVDGLETGLLALRSALADLASPPALAVYDCGDGLEPLRRAACARLGARFVGAAERRKLAARLGAQAALEGLEGLPAGPGAARNAALLEAAGSGLLIVDPAAASGAVRAPDLERGAALRSGVGPRRWLFAEEAAALIGAPREPYWLLELLDVLGAKAGTLAAQAEADGTLDLSGLGDTWVGRGSAVVRLAYLGAMGPGVVEGAGALDLDTRTRQALWADGRLLRAALDGEPSVSYAPKLALHDRPSLRAHAFGLDASELVPPFLPSGPDARGLFRALFGLIQPEACAAELPWAAAVERAPAEPESGAPRLGGLLGELAAAVPGPLKRVSAGEALARAGAGIALLADRSEADWQRWARNVRWNAIRGRLEARLAQVSSIHSKGPVPWRRVADAYVEKLRRSLVDPRLLVPREAADAAHGRRLVLQSARLLEAWPEIWAAANK